MEPEWRELKKKGRGGDKSRPEVPENPWFSSKPNQQIRIVKRDPIAASKPGPDAEDKSLWPTLGASGSDRRQPEVGLFRAADQVKPIVKALSGAKVLKQPVNLKPDQPANPKSDPSERKFNAKREENDCKTAVSDEDSSWTNVSSRRHRQLREKVPAENSTQSQFAKVRENAGRGEGEGSSGGQALDSSAGGATKQDEVSGGQTSEGKPEVKIKPELTEEEQEALREKRRARRRIEKEMKKKRKEEEKRRKMYEPKSVKIQFIDSDVLQRVIGNQPLASSSSSTSRKKSKAAGAAQESRPQPEEKSLKFFDEEYPSLAEVSGKPSKSGNVSRTGEALSTNRRLSVDGSGSEWETEEEEDDRLEADEGPLEQKSGTESRTVLVESENRKEVRSILKQKSTRNSVSDSEEKKTTSFAQILASKPKLETQTSSNPDPPTVQPQPAVVTESKKVKRKDPITFDLFQALQVSTSKRTGVASSKKATPVMGSKLATGRNEKATRSGNILDSSAPTKRRGKEREKPKKKRPSKMKKIILQDREERRERRRLLAELTAPKTKNEISPENGEKPLGLEGVNSQTTEQVGESDKIGSEALTEEAEAKQPEAQDSINKAADEATPANPDAADPDPALPAEPESQNLVGQVMKEILEETPLQKAKRLIHSRKFRDYCDHLLDDQLNQCAVRLLDDMVRFQDRQYHKDPIKAKTKRRYVAGMKEIKKFLTVKKITALLIAPDVETVQTKGGLNDLIGELQDLAAKNSVPCFFVLNRKNLGKAVKRKVGVSAVGILNYQGSEVNFHQMVELQTALKESYREKLKAAILEVGGTWDQMEEAKPEELQIEAKPVNPVVSELDELSQKLIRLMK